MFLSQSLKRISYPSVTGTDPIQMHMQRSGKPKHTSIQVITGWWMLILKDSLTTLTIRGGYQDPLETIGRFFFTSYVRYATEERFSFIPCCNRANATASMTIQHSVTWRSIFFIPLPFKCYLLININIKNTPNRSLDFNDILLLNLKASSIFAIFKSPYITNIFIQIYIYSGVL